MNADVISFETSHSDRELLKVFCDFYYPTTSASASGTSVPPDAEMTKPLRKMAQVISAKWLSNILAT
ncbi:MAG: hypothetical protein CL814_18500 [Confluentimicrobium sp.]|nr:hypothetical protein [Actibacterium sp.]|tara:strand:+ start:2416 stop:2616 length:201 start_codon:yes stop_codon:yes gene_type:complete